MIRARAPVGPAGRAWGGLDPFHSHCGLHGFDSQRAARIFRRNLMPLRSIIAFIVIALVPVVARAEEKSAPPPKSEVKDGVRIERDIAYVPDGDSSQRLDLYLPEKSADKPLPLLVWVHGGGWLGGSKSENPGSALTARGEYASASVEYRFSDKALFPAQIEDCQAAVRFLRANAKKYNI